MSWSKIVVITLAVVGCSKDSAPSSETKSSAPSGPAAPAAAGGASSSTAANALVPAKIEGLKDACGWLPKATADRLAPGTSRLEGTQFPLSCAARGKLSAIEITFGSEFSTRERTGETVAGLGVAATVERNDPTSKGDVYLIIELGKADDGMFKTLRVEVAGHDGKDHKDDAIALAREVLAQLK